VQIAVGEHLDAIRPVLAAFGSQDRHLSEAQLQQAWAAYDELRRLFG
jgi:hypothetical protein